MKRQLFASSLLSLILVMAFTFSETTRSAETTTVETKTETTKPLPSAGTTVEKTTIQKTETEPAPAVTPAKPAVTQPVSKKKWARRAPKKEITVTTTQTTIETRPRAVYSPKALKKMGKAGALCSPGFKAYTGNVQKNICNVQAEPPDMAYTCVWKEKGPSTFMATPMGPCTLDFAEHRGNMAMHRSHYKSNPPFSYGTDVQCCFRAAAGTEVIRKEIEVK